MASRNRRVDLVELIVVVVYTALTAYLCACDAPPRMALVLRDTVTPFQVKLRARNKGAEHSAAVWLPLRFEAQPRRGASGQF